MSVVAFLIVGLLMGVIARAIVPKNERMTLLTTLALGIAGALLGGVVSSWIYASSDLLTLHPTTVIFSVLGALLVLVFTNVTGGRTHRRV
jgi:uncharacterized membrane protein YeaQ/YmgE (transglycosylase-associated protein family)